MPALQNRQILLRRHLGLPQPRHLHTPLVLAADGQKLSKQNGAAPVDTGRPAEVLAAAARALGLDLAEGLSADAVRAEALRQWRLRLEQE